MVQNYRCVYLSVTSVAVLGFEDYDEYESEVYGSSLGEMRNIVQLFSWYDRRQRSIGLGYGI